MSRVQVTELRSVDGTVSGGYHYCVVDYYGTEHSFVPSVSRFYNGKNHSVADEDYWFEYAKENSFEKRRWINHVKVIRALPDEAWIVRPAPAYLVEFKYPAVDTGIQRIWVRAEDLVVE